MEDENDYFYLDEGFDPSKLKVAELKRVFIKHNVDFNTSAKKAELLEVFNAKIAPRAVELLHKARSVKPDGTGIQLTPGRGTPRRASKAKLSDLFSAVIDQAQASETEESDIDLTARPKPKQKPSSAFSDENPFQSGSEASPAPKKNKLVKRKKSSVTIVEPAAKHAEEKTELPTSAPASKPQSRPYRGGYLSMMNTPPMSVKQPEAEERDGFKTATPSRTTAASPFKKFMTPVKPVYTKTPPQEVATAAEDAASAVTAPADTPASPVSTPIQKPKKPRVSTPYPSKGVLASIARRRTAVTRDDSGGSDEMDVDDDNVGSTEEEGEADETDPEYNLLLEQRRRRRMLKSKQRSGSFGLSKLLGVLLAGYLIWYRFRLQQEGYCDGNVITTPEEAMEVEGNALSFLKPSCHPCPPHGHCQNRRLVSCDHEFVLQPRYRKPFDVLSTNPVTAPFFPMRCKPDTETKRKVAVLIDAVTEQLNERAGEVECKRKTVNPGKLWPEGEGVVVMKDRGYSISQLRDKFYRMKDPSLPDARFEDLWKLAIRDLKSMKDEIDYIPADSQELEEYLVSRYPKYPFACFVRLQVAKAIIKHKISLSVSLLISMFLFLLRRLWRRYSREVSEANELVEIVFEKLQDQEHNHYVDPVLSPTPALSVTQLKDFLMTGDNWSDAKRRERVWKRAYAKIENNSNVRSRVAEIKGEPHHVWEWIGGYGLTAERSPRVAKLYPTA